MRFIFPMMRALCNRWPHLTYGTSLGLIAFLIPLSLHAQDSLADKKYSPHFASLKSDEVNMRAGPGTNYPIVWVYHRARLPVEVTAEFDVWRRVQDAEGSEGWVHKAMLRNDRYGLTLGKQTALRIKPGDTAPAKAMIGQAVIGNLLACETAWCKLEFKGIKGWMKKADFWGAYPSETFDE